MAAAEASVAARLQAAVKRVADLTVVRHRGRLYHLTGLPHRAMPPGRRRSRGRGELPVPVPLGGGDDPPPRIHIHRVARGDDITAMAAGMPVGVAPRAQFDLINGFRPGRTLRVGDAVKVVTE